MNSHPHGRPGKIYTDLADGTRITTAHAMPLKSDATALLLQRRPDHQVGANSPITKADQRAPEKQHPLITHQECDWRKLVYVFSIFRRRHS